MILIPRVSGITENSINKHKIFTIYLLPKNLFAVIKTMLDLFVGLKRILKRRTVHIDNAVFRLHWLLTSVILISFSAVITARQYVGQPIDCLIETEQIPPSMINTYCWISQTFLIPSAFHKKVGVEVPHPGVDNSRHIASSDRKYYSYYQWVCFVLFIQGVLFYVPYYLWKVWEGGLMRSITMGMQIAILADEERGYKKKLLIDYLFRHLKMHHYYAFKYFFCEVLCLLNIIGQMYLTDKFFEGEFLSYGLNIIKYTQKEPKDRIDPMVFIFPRMTKCTFHYYGSSGDVQKKDALCLLPLNVVNEKVYIFIWFWFVILSVITCLVIISRLFIFFSVSLRSRILKTRCRFSNSKYLNIICKHGNIGDFFVLYLLAKNIDPIIMQDIVAEIGKRIERNDMISNLTSNGDIGERINML